MDSRTVSAGTTFNAYSTWDHRTPIELEAQYYPYGTETDVWGGENVNDYYFPVYDNAQTTRNPDGLYFPHVIAPDKVCIG